MKKLYFDILCGASGDMILSSLIDLGYPLEHLNDFLARLSVEKISITAEKTTRNGIQCTFIDPKWEQASQYRHLHQILEIIKSGNFNGSVYRRCEVVLNRLAEAEAAVHGISKERVHFHEIGAVDTIIDILGVSLGLEYLGIEEITYSVLTDGHGTIKAAHGVMPVPVPATSHMIQGLTLKTLDIETELLTPTGAALLTALGKQLPVMEEGKLIKTGYGCGTKVFENYPNLLRVNLYESDDKVITGDSVYLIETDMDHISAEVMGHVAGRLFESGALDVSFTPVYMKKGRPAYRLTVMASDSDYRRLIDLIIIHTRTLGVRVQRVQRVLAAREKREREFMGMRTGEKVCTYKGYSFSKLEYDALDNLSRSTNVPLIELMERYVKEKE